MIGGRPVEFVQNPTQRTVHWLARLRPPTAVVLIVALLGLSWTVVYLAGGADRLPPHLFYVPIVVSAVRFRRLGGIAAAVASMLAAGPLLLAQVATGTAQQPSDWLARGGFFVLGGLLIAGLVRGIEHAHEQELTLATRHRDLIERAGAIVQSVSHEFRTPLTVITGSVELLNSRELVAPAGRELLGAMVRASQRLDHLTRVVLAATDDLPDIVLEQAPLVLEDVVAEVVRHLPRDGGHDRVALDVAPDARVIVGPPVILRTLLGILVDNALKFAPIDTPVEVTAKREPGEVVITVRDHGPGIPEEDLGRIYDAFTQADRRTADAKGGLGLGLSAARRLALQVNGTVEVGAARTGGTIASVRLPQRREADVRSSVRLALSGASSTVDMAIDSPIAVRRLV
jgi:signal transduction histidine kinase